MKRFLTILIVLVCLSLPLVAAQPQHYLTRDCAIFLQLDRIPTLLEQAERYAVLFGLDLAKGDLSKKISSALFGQEGFPGLDLERPLAIFLLYQGQAVSGGVCMVPISGQSLFRSVVLSRLPLGNLPIQYRDGYAIIASSPAVMSSFSGGAKKSLTLSKDAQVSLYVDLALFKDEVQKAMQQQLEDKQTVGTQLMRSLSSFLTDWFQQMRGVSYSFSLGRKGIEFGYAADLLPGGSMASMLEALPAGSPDLITLLPADSYLAAGSRINLKASLSSFEPFLGLFDTLQPELGTILKEYLRGAASLYGNDYALALVPSKTRGLSALAVIRQARGSTRALYRKLVERLNGLRVVQRLRESDARFGLSYETAAGSIAGVSYDTIRLNFSNPVGCSDATRRQLALVREMLTCHVAAKGGVEYWALGADAKARLSGMLEGKERAFKTSPAWQTMTAAWGQYAKNGLLYLSLPSFLREIAALAKYFDPDSVPLRSLEGMLSRLPQDGGIYAMSRYARNTITVRGLIGESLLQSMAQLFLALSNMMEKASLDE